MQILQYDEFSEIINWFRIDDYENAAAIEIGRFESFPTQVRKYVVSLLGATESTKSARQAALNEHTSFRVIHASAGCPRASIRNTRDCVCVSDGNDDLASDVSYFRGKYTLDRLSILSSYDLNKTRIYIFAQTFLITIINNFAM